MTTVAIAGLHPPETCWLKVGLAETMAALVAVNSIVLVTLLILAEAVDMTAQQLAAAAVQVQGQDRTEPMATTAILVALVA